MIPRDLKVLHTAMCAQVLQNYIIDMKANNWFTGVFKNFVNNFLQQFTKLESKFFDIYFEHKEEDTVELYEAYDKYIKAVATVPLWEMKYMTDIIEAYHIDQKSMVGIAKKIHKNNTKKVDDEVSN
jgi:hypothetical protein